MSLGVEFEHDSSLNHIKHESWAWSGNISRRWGGFVR